LGGGTAAILKSPSGIKLKYAARLQFKTEADKSSNNVAKDEAILLGLRKLQAMEVRHYILKTDSKVIASQIKKECIVRDETLETSSSRTKDREILQGIHNPIQRKNKEFRGR
jgi:ribonuclease HI